MTADSQIEALPFWTGKPVLTLLEGGRTNRNFLAIEDGRRYFVRSGSDIPHLGITRAAERRAHAKAAAAGLAPPIRFAEGPILITDFIDGTPLGALTDATLAAIARHLKALHQIPAAGDLPLFCPTTIALTYLDRLGRADIPLDRAALRRHLEDLPRATAQCLVHGDLIPENFIRRADAGLSLIDWEYAGNGLPEIDVALLIANFDLPPAAARDFIAAYGGADPDLIAKFQIAGAIREALWCCLQIHFGTPSADLPDYTQKCAARVRRMLA